MAEDAKSHTQRQGLRNLLTGVVVFGMLVVVGVPLNRVGPANTRVSLFEVGVAPALVAFVLVEIVLAARPKWRRLRHAPRFRRSATFVAAGLALGFAAVQAWRTAEALQTGSTASWTAVFTAGFATMLALGFVISGIGRINGLVVLCILDPWSLPADVYSAENLDIPGLTQLSLMFISVPVLLLLVWGLGHLVVMLRVEAKERASDDAYRGRGRAWLQTGLPLVASGLLPLGITYALLRLPRSLEVWGMEPEGWNAGYFEALMVLSLLSVAGAYLATPVGAVSRELTRFTGARLDAGSLSWARLQVACASAAFLAAVFSLDWMLLDLGVFPWATPVVLLLGLLADAWWATRVQRQGVLVAVREERLALRAVARVMLLAQQGLTVRVRGLTTGIFHTFWGPHAPLEILAPEQDAEAIAVALETGAVENVGSGGMAWSGLWGATRRHGLLLMGVLVVAVGLAHTPTWLRAAVDAESMRFELVEVDDSSELVSEVVASRLPPGFYVEAESEGGDALFVIVAPGHDASPERALARARAWARALKLPARRLVWKPKTVRDWSLDLSANPPSYEWRTYLVHEEPLLSTADVADARANMVGESWFDPAEHYVEVHLTERGARRQVDIARGLAGKRIAVLIDERARFVWSVRNPRTDGRLRLNVSSEEDARLLAAGLRKGAQR